MVFNGIEAVQSLAKDVNAKSFVIHEKGVKTRSLRQRSVGSTKKVQSELGTFANTPEYQNGQYFIMLFDGESVPRTNKEATACATAEFSLGAVHTPTPEPQYNQTITGFSLGEVEQRAGQIAENAILKYKIEQQEKEIKQLEQEIDEPTTDYTETILSALSGFMGNKQQPQKPAVNGILTPDNDIRGVNGQKANPEKSIKESIAQLEQLVGGKEQLALKLNKLVGRLQKNPMLLDLL